MLEIKFTGIMNNIMAGFYRSKYKPTIKPSKSVPMEGDSHLMFSTQFESSDARRAFPCFDEPNLKASFDFSIEIPEDLVALSNMPMKGAKETKKGFNVVSFERSPVMSTYVSYLKNSYVSVLSLFCGTPILYSLCMVMNHRSANVCIAFGLGFRRFGVRRRLH